MPDRNYEEEGAGARVCSFKKVSLHLWLVSYARSYAHMHIWIRPHEQAAWQSHANQMLCCLLHVYALVLWISQSDRLLNQEASFPHMTDCGCFFCQTVIKSNLEYLECLIFLKLNVWLLVTKENVSFNFERVEIQVNCIFGCYDGWFDTLIFFNSI